MFLDTAEKLNTINKTLAFPFGDWSYTLVLGLLFWLLLALAIIFRNRLLLLSQKFKGRTIVAVLIILLWSPMFFDVFFSSWQSIFQRGQDITAPSEVKVKNRLCLVDKNQKLGQSVCSLIPYIEEVQATVPDQSKIVLTSGGYYSLFLKYYFIPKFKMSEPESADYWLMYLPEPAFHLNNNQELIETRPDREVNWGRWQLLKFLNDGQVILKKL